MTEEKRDDGVGLVFLLVRMLGQRMMTLVTHTQIQEGGSTCPPRHAQTL